MSSQPVPKKRLKERIISPIREFIHDSRSVGILLVCCTVASLALSNSSWGSPYTGFWERELTVPVPDLHLPHTILHWINDLLMAVFFFLVGLEIKRELLRGELSSIRKSMLPVFAATGGMVVPALLYLLWCGGGPAARGWGIPMATDIAFSLGILSLLGKKAPLSLRVFLTALAIIDDLGGILTIAIFYAGDLQWSYLWMAAALFLALGVMNLLKVKNHLLYIVPGLVLWYLVFNSGVHATIAGVLLAMTLPLNQIEKLEHRLHDPVNFIIMPVFALANTAILLPGDLSAAIGSPLSFGILTGLVLGKPLGILLFSRISVALGIASLPGVIGWKDILGAGMVAGIGFTMSIFMATLAFTEPAMQVTAKVSIIAASTLAGILGYVYLLNRSRKKGRIAEVQAEFRDSE